MKKRPGGTDHTMRRSQDFDIAPVEERLRQIDRPLDERLRPYGIDPEDVEREEVIVEDEQVLSSESAASVHQLRPDTLAEMKAWIGVDDESAPVATMEELPPRLPDPEELKAAFGSEEAVEEDPREVIYDALWLSLYRDRRSLPDWDELLDMVIDLSELFVPFVPVKVIHVKRDAVFEVGHQVSVLFSDVIRIEDGGTLRYTGGMRIDTAFLDGVP